MNNMVETFDDIVWLYEKARRNYPNNKKQIQQLNYMIESSTDFDHLSGELKKQFDEIKQYVKEHKNDNS